MKAYIVYPHQLYEVIKIKNIFEGEYGTIDYIFIVEEYLYFRYFNFHHLKIGFHINSMNSYQEELNVYFNSPHYIKLGIKPPQICYIKSEELDSTEKLIDIVHNKYKVKEIISHDPTDDYLRRHTELHVEMINKEIKLEKNKLSIKYLNSPNFIFTDKEVREYFSKNKFFMNSFYIYSRKKLNVLLVNDKPIGGKWSYDKENRLKIPKNHNFQSEENFKWEYTRAEAKNVLRNFLENRFIFFGDYEDAIVQDKSFLYHSTISPYLNVGLLDPLEVVEEALKYYEKHKENIKLATIEGFVRQIIGWREYMRAVYILKGREIRTQNFFKFKNKLPYSFWTAETDNKIINNTIQKTIKYAYNHHIERLMILGNYMLLKEYDPDDVYKWFMEMYVDAYDWVMVPNVYSMSQYADGGLITTKPYVSGSSYILKMSDYDKKSCGAEWTLEWDILYWEFIYKHREAFKNNFRMSMMVKMAIKRFEK